MEPNRNAEAVEAVEVPIAEDTVASDRQASRADRTVLGTRSSTDELVVVMPTRVRVDSRVVLAHCSTSWLMNFALNILILAKLEGWTEASWWMVFIPAWIHHTLQLPLQYFQIVHREYFLLKQLGPPPPEDATPGLHLQYNVLKATRMRTFVIDVINACLESIGLCLAKVLFVRNLEHVWTDGAAWGSFRTIFSPVWGAWLIITTVSCLKNRHERMVGGARDLMFLFLLFVAFKLDQQSSYSWRLVFLIPWMWFSAMFLLTCMVFVLLVFARAWTRFSELVLPLGFFSLLLSCVPQFISYIALVDRLDGNGEVSYEAILVPNALSWGLMWISSLVVCWGLHQKEQLRASLQASGAVWTANEHLAQHVHQTIEAAQQRVDDLNEEEIANLVQEMMQGKTKPSQLVKIGGALFRRISAGLGTELHSVDGTAGAAKQAEGLLANEASATQDGQNAEETIGTSVMKNSVLEACEDLCDEGCSSPTQDVLSILSNEIHDEGSAEKGQNGCATTVVTVDNIIDSKMNHHRPSDTASDDGYCIICYDATATCVFLECGHGGYCRKCANRLFVRPPHECPTCRQKIDQVQGAPNLDSGARPCQCSHQV